MTAAVADKLKSIFKEWDADGDGTISPAELSAVLQALGAFSDADLERLMAEVDANKNGVIEYEEFIDWLTAPGAMIHVVNDKVAVFDLEGALKPLFDVYDKKRTGYVDRDEFKEAYGIVTGALEYTLSNEGAKRHFDDAEIAFRAANVSNTGQITFKEFVDWQRKNVRDSGLTNDQLGKLFPKLAEVVRHVFQMADATEKQGAVGEQHVDLLKKHFEDIQKAAAQLFKGSNRLGSTEAPKIDHGTFTNPWSEPPVGISMKRLVHAHMQVPIPTVDVRDFDTQVVNVLPEVPKKDDDAARRWIARLDRVVRFTSGRTSNTSYYYAWTGLQWMEASAADFQEARQSMAPEYRLLALLYTEGHFQETATWSQIQAALDGGEDLRILCPEKRAEFESNMRELVTGMLSEQRGGGQVSEREIDAFMQAEVALSPLQTMSALCEMGVVPHDPIWDDPH